MFFVLFRFCSLHLSPHFSRAKFAVDARHKAGSHSNLLQLPYNEAATVKFIRLEGDFFENL